MKNYTNFDDWCIHEGGLGSGASKKDWLINESTGSIGLFKYPRQHTYKEGVLTGEHWAEKIASEIAKIIKIPCASIDIGVYKGEIGAMSYIIIDNNKESLLEGVQYIMKKYPNFDTETLYDETTNTRYSLQMILECIDDIPFKTDFLKIPIFDCLIGNSDRHHSNWGIIVDKSGFPLRMAPLYDNSSSLCCREKEEEIDNILRDKHRFKAIIDSKSKSCIKWMNEKKIRHFELLTKLSESYYDETIEIIKNIEENLTDDSIYNIVYGIDEEIMSNKRQKLVSEFLMNRRDKMLEIYSR